MKLTSERKISAYQYCIDEIVADYPYDNGGATPFMCLLLTKWYIINMGRRLSIYDLKRLFPEIFECKPSYYIGEFTGWFPNDDEGNTIRTVCLQWCIDKLQSSI